MKRPDVSVIIPVLNEEAGITAVISHVRMVSSGSGVEIIVVDGNSTGSTLAAINDGDIVGVKSPAGRAVQMNRGAGLASGEMLLFLHADTMLPPKAFSLAGEALRSGRYAAGAFSLGLDSKRASLRITESAARFRTRLTGIPFGDQAIFMARDYFMRIGGYAAIPLMEDVEIMKRIRKRGDRIIILPERVATSARKWEREGVLYSIIRNLFIQLAYFLGASPAWLADIYYRRNAVDK